MEAWEALAFHPEYPSVPGIIVVPDMAGHPRMHKIDAVGGGAMIDKYACAALTGLLAGWNTEVHFDPETLAQEAWRLAVEMAKARPRFKPPPAAIDNGGPRLIEG